MCVYTDYPLWWICIGSPSAVNVMPINCLENQLYGLESGVRKSPGLTYNNCPIGSEILPFIYLVFLNL